MNHTAHYLATYLCTLHSKCVDRSSREELVTLLLALSPSIPASVRPNRSQSGRSHRKHQRQPKQSRTETCTLSQP